MAKTRLKQMAGLEKRRIEFNSWSNQTLAKVEHQLPLGTAHFPGPFRELRMTVQCDDGQRGDPGCSGKVSQVRTPSPNQCQTTTAALSHWQQDVVPLKMARGRTMMGPCEALSTSHPQCDPSKRAKRSGPGKVKIVEGNGPSANRERWPLSNGCMARKHDSAASIHVYIYICACCFFYGDPQQNVCFLLAPVHTKTSRVPSKRHPHPRAC